MLRRSPFFLYSAVPTYDRGAKSGRVSGHASSAVPMFMRAKSSRKFFDENTNNQIKADRKTRGSGSLSMTLRMISGDRKAGFTNLGSKPFMGLRETLNQRAYVDGMLNNRKRLEWTAPWHQLASSHERKQLQRNRSRTRHVYEITGTPDHQLSGLESLDIAAMRLCEVTAQRWPFVQSSVLQVLQWWCEPQFDSFNGDFVDNDPDLIRAIARYNEDKVDNEAIAQRHLATLCSAPQIAAMKSRTFQAMLQGYACSGVRAPASVEMALIRGVGEHLVALRSPPERLFAVMLQTLCIGIVRHQSFADFSKTGLIDVSRACINSVAANKMPAMVALSMRQVLRKDPDAAVEMAFCASVYCSSNNLKDDSTTSSTASGITVPPCDIDINGNQISTELLASHLPSRPLLTLTLSWGFSPAVCARLTKPASAVWLFELATSALVALVDCAIPCGDARRVLRAVELVTAACSRWMQLVNGDDCADLSSRDRWSSAAVLISVSKLAPVLEQLVLVENGRRGDDGDSQELIAGESDPVATEDTQQQQSSDAEDSTAASTSSPRKFLRPPPMSPTSFSADRVVFVSAHNDNDSADEEDAAARFERETENATTQFAETMRLAVKTAMDLIAPSFGIESKAEEQLQIAQSSEQDSVSVVEDEYAKQQSASSAPDVRVPRHVIAELADALSFVASCDVFAKSQQRRAEEMVAVASEMALGA